MWSPDKDEEIGDEQKEIDWTLSSERWRSIPGGVNSPVRAFKAVGVPPTFIDRAKGSKIWDVDGNEYIDYVGSWGPMILGHAHPKVVAALKKAISKGNELRCPHPSGS